ncbi:NFACT RNA binding domain-containing protein [Thermithiobacillus tepidarius DSM 3134]|uniref:NFACT RNA binding domain-containing protein n=1 Tax=Thermithiobacillus tepidarius TaxID=929 RepID=UPI0012DD9846|nr:NFACT RNA binding domain-containing protein [Thermithiobacillus tepidarius]
MTTTPAKPQAAAPPGRFNMDALQLQCAAACLADALRGARLTEVRSAPGGIVLTFGTRDLLLQIARAPLGLWLADALPEAESPPFANLARQQLQGLHLQAIDAPHPDRVLCLRFERRHISGRRDQRTLVAEWLGQRSNLVLLEGDGRMRFAWRWDEVTAAEARILPQQPYRPPAGMGGERLWFIAPRLRPPLPPAAQDDLAATAEAARRQCRPWHRLRRDDHDLLYPIVLPGWDELGPADFLTGWPAFLRERTGAHAQAPLQTALRQRLRQLVHRESETLRKVRADVERLQDPARYRRWGQALYTLPDRIPQSDAVEALDYNAEPPAAIRVPVTPGLPLHQQAEGYFKQARKAERGLAQALERQRALEDRLAALQALSRELDSGEGTPASIAARLEALHPPAETGKTKPRAARAGNGNAEPLRVSVDGYEILVGRSARQNETITFKLARPWDIWLHVQDHPGAHVLIRMPKQEKRPPDRVLAQAAALALRHSPRAGQAADVDWTQARFVTRKPGGGPGQVLYREFRTWRVDVDAGA